MDLSTSDICCNLYRASPERHPCTDEIWLCHPGACHLGANWEFYDENFFNFGNPRVPHRIKLTTNHPKRAKHVGRFIPNGYRWKFHRGIHCPGCSFKHQCFRCGQVLPHCQMPTTKAVCRTREKT